MANSDSIFYNRSSRAWGFHHFLKPGGVIAFEDKYFLSWQSYADALFSPALLFFGFMRTLFFEFGARLASQASSHCGAVPSRRRR
jgi:hypothetical protein